MGFLSGLFESEEKKRRKSHFRNLVAVAMADGDIDDDETQLLLLLGQKNYLTPAEIQQVLQSPEDVRFVVPQNPRQALDYLWEMVQMMMIDGHIHAREKAFCKGIALRYGFRPAVVDKIVDTIIEGIARGVVAEMALHRLLANLDD